VGHQITITTFGYLHGPAPKDVDITLDLRRHFRDPHVSPEMRHLTARDARVQNAVLGTPGIAQLLDATLAAATAYLSGPSAGPLSIATGCAGGRHRAGVVGAELHRRLSGHHNVTLIHRDLDKAVVER
jgi:UPF0042 nucleotide-binding protein